MGATVTDDSCLTLKGQVLVGQLEELKGRLALALEDGALAPYQYPVHVFDGWRPNLMVWRRSFWRKPLGLRARVTKSSAHWKAFEVRESKDYEPEFDSGYRVFFVSDEGELATFNQYARDGAVVVSVPTLKTETALKHWVTGLKVILDGHSRRRSDGSVYFVAY